MISSIDVEKFTRTLWELGILTDYEQFMLWRKIMDIEVAKLAEWY
jgi:hypothetical protein